MAIVNDLQNRRDLKDLAIIKLNRSARQVRALARGDVDKRATVAAWYDLCEEQIVLEYDIDRLETNSNWVKPTPQGKRLKEYNLAIVEKQKTRLKDIPAAIDAALKTLGIVKG